MKTLVAILALLSFSTIYAQQAEDFFVEINEISINNSPGVQSFAHATYNDKWLILGGRTDGLHQRQPFASFLASDNNTMVYVVDPIGNQTYSKSLSSLPAGILEQLQSTNLEFEQRDSILYIIGGYGFSTTANDHITYPNLTAVDVPGLMNAVINNTGITTYFRQITDNNLRVTGGYLDRVGETYYLAGGQNFEGRYNPMGPTHGSGFIQEYTDAIKKFEIQDDGTNLTIANYSAWVDSANLHRRDYNMAMQIFPAGDTGLTMFSGVFQHTADLPWLNTVDVLGSGYTVVPNFDQHLNQYHSAHMAVYDGANNAMHTTFFGGMSRYTLDNNNQLVDDPDVPFVNTISMVTRYANGTMEEFKTGEMPALLGSSAEFIPLENNFLSPELDLIYLDSLPYAKILVGHIIGGIESTLPNIFFINDGSQSQATTRIFEVYITRGVSSTPEKIDGNNFFTTALFPNPASKHFTLDVQTPYAVPLSIKLLNAKGQTVKTIFEGNTDKDTFKVNIRDLPSGMYMVQLTSAQMNKTLKFVVE